MEQWKDIIGYEGYQVSDWGRVKSLNHRHTGNERVPVGFKDEDGCLRVNLYKGGKRKTCLVHRLAAEAFIPNPEGLTEVNHRNEDKQSNVVSSLEWCSRKYNCNFGTRNERVAKAHGRTVFRYTKDGSLVRSYPSSKEVGRRTGYANGHIVNCCNGKLKQAYGYLWPYNLFAPRGRLF